jgi:hypothetical protein
MRIVLVVSHHGQYSGTSASVRVIASGTAVMLTVNAEK